MMLYGNGIRLLENKWRARIIGSPAVLKTAALTGFGVRVPGSPPQLIKECVVKKKGYVDVEIELDDKTFIKIALAAHEHNMTLNAFIVMLLKKYIKECETSNRK